MLAVQPSKSLRGLKPTIGLKLCTEADQYLNQKFYLFTHHNCFHTFICKNCGEIFNRNRCDKRENKFCSVSCSTKYYKRIAKERKFKLLYKIVSEDDLKAFIKKNENFVYHSIFTKYPSEYHEDLIDFWNEYSVKFAHTLKGRGIRTCMKYLDKALKYRFLHLHKNKREVFYDECSLKVQEHILGTYNDLRG